MDNICYLTARKAYKHDFKHKSQGWFTPKEYSSSKLKLDHDSPRVCHACMLPTYNLQYDLIYFQGALKYSDITPERIVWFSPLRNWVMVERCACGGVIWRSAKGVPWRIIADNRWSTPCRKSGIDTDRRESIERMILSRGRTWLIRESLFHMEATNIRDDNAHYGHMGTFRGQD